MARPKRVYPNSLPKFNKLHTRKVKMYSGVELTALHLIKETTHFFISIEAWSSMCSGFKKLKYNFNLEYNIPLLRDEYALKILEENGWDDWIEKNSDSVDLQEAISFLKKLFPNKELVFFHELNQIMSSYCHGNFIEYKDGVEIERCDFHKECGERQVNKYNNIIREEIGDLPKELTDMLEEANSVKGAGDEWSKKYQAYKKKENDYINSKRDLTKNLIELASHSVVCPFISSTPSVEGMTYEYASDIYFVQTEDKVYFELERHY